MAPTDNNTSIVAMAVAGTTASVNIPKHENASFWAGRDSFAAVAARSLPAKKQPAELPTPPNSISPSLPPQGFQGRSSEAPPTPPVPTHFDSDLDLQDAVDHANAQGRPRHGLAVNRGLDQMADMDTAGAITPGLLAKHHLPGILIDHGPLAIRHVMGFLTTSVPGFSGIPPAKARRLVVGALEGRGGDGEQGGIDGDVIFEKVGWGRWDARRRGQSPRDAQAMPPSQHHRPTRPTSQGHHPALQIPGQHARPDRGREPTSTTSMAGESAAFSHDSEMEYGRSVGEVSMLEHEADKMSLDEEDSCSSSEPPDHPTLDYELDDATDEEDWASIGAAALRQGSFPRTSTSRREPTNHSYSTHLHPNAGRRGGGPPSSMLVKAVPASQPPVTYQNPSRRDAPVHGGLSVSPLPNGALDGSDLQEREAIEALVKLSSI